MKPVVVDFETPYDKDVCVDAIGLKNYAAQVDAYLVSIVSDDLEFCGTPAQALQMLGDSWWKDPGLKFVAANSNFDQAFFEKHFGNTANEWHCLLDQSAGNQLPGNVAGAAKAVLGIQLDKTIRDQMKGVRFEELPDARQQEVADYCLTDSRVEKQLFHKIPQLSSTEAAIAEHTRMCNRRGVHINMEAVDQDLVYLERLRHEAINRLPWVHEDRKPLSYDAFAEHCLRHGVDAPASLDKRDEQCIRWIAANPELAKLVMSMRVVRGTSTKSKKLKVLQAEVCDGVYPLNLRYCGAPHTKRWSSAGFNVQNLDSSGDAFAEEMSEWEEFEDDDSPGIDMRRYLVPPPGCRFALIDYAQIEPRCLHWLAGNEAMLSAMRSGMEIYEAYARAALGWRAGILKDENVPLRKVCKVHVISGGYAGGVEAFRRGAAKEGLTLTDSELQAQVDKFRAANPLIRSFWGRMKELIRAAARDRDRELCMQMPNGETLKHFHVRSQADGNYSSFKIRGDTSHNSRIPSLWHGLLTENVTQRMARDVLAEAVLRVERAGIPVIFTSHDELICAVPINGAEEALIEAERLMLIPPAWAEDLPLGVEGKIADHYCK